jgi:2-keto-4-pentenoate hydratase/2-oxohepta-3-ene-1,7-dioic acid hydratase in catechol pathway
MIVLTFQMNDQDYLGIKTDEGILDVAAAGRALGAAGLADTPRAFYAAGLAALPALQEFTALALEAESRSAWLLAEDRLELGPCIPAPGKIICVGLNYRRHAEESNLEIPSVPVLFSKYRNAIAAPGAPVALPAQFKRFDYEAELAVVIGRRAKYVPQEQALEHVLGYCNANDLSERGLQGLTSQWMLGKTLDGFLPVGPYLITADEAGDPQDWPVRSWLNDEPRQDSSTADMIFPVAELVSFISQHMTLEPGDLISTGTPQGVIAGMPQPRAWMKPGDVVTVEVGPLGRLTNPLVAEETPEGSA